MAKLNVWKRLFPSGIRAKTHEGAVAQKVGPYRELRRTVMTCLPWEDTFYEKGNKVAERIADLVTKNKSEDVSALAREARDKMQCATRRSFLSVSSLAARERGASWRKHSST